MEKEHSTKVNAWHIMPIVLVFLFISHHSTLRSQDIHFSQIDVNPILYNPAYSGFFDGNARFGLCYRNQWASVSRAFQTVAATAEVSLRRRRYYGDGICVGLILYNDRAGTLQYGTTAGNIILSYYKSLSGRNNNFISLAIEGGMGQAGFNTSNIEMRDPEEFDNTSESFPTIGVGAAWFYQPNDDNYFRVGIAGQNLNRPNISYMEMSDAYIERKFSAYARAELRHWSTVSLMPLAACMLQRNYREILLGLDAKYYISESSHRNIAFSAGLHYRWRDALMVELTAEYNAFVFAFTYDANISKLTPASKSIGSFEIGITYRLMKTKRVQRKAMPCPNM